LRLKLQKTFEPPKNNNFYFERMLQKHTAKTQTENSAQQSKMQNFFVLLERYNRRKFPPFSFIFF